MKLKEDVIGQRRRLAKYIKRLQRFRRFLGDFSANLLRWIFGALFEVHFCTLFGLRRVREMPVSRDFLRLNSGFWPVFRPIFHRTFHRVFTLVRASAS